VACDLLKPRVDFAKDVRTERTSRGKDITCHRDEHASPVEDDFETSLVKPLPERAAAAEDF
jgi:hypothetical protein